MNKRLGVQTLMVIALIVLVSWPEYYTSRPNTVWRFAPELQQAAEAAELSTYGYSDDQRTARRGTGSLFGADAAERRESLGRPGQKDEPARAFSLAPGVAEAGGKINALMGRARTSLNTPIPYARVLLRNIRTGAVEARATANEEGRYSFLDIDASAYIVELLGADGTVVASSEMVALAAGDMRETTVRVSATAATTNAAFNGRLTGSLINATGGTPGLPTDVDNTGDTSGLVRSGDVNRTLDTTTDANQVSPR